MNGGNGFSSSFNASFSRLWVRLTLAFVAVTLIAVGAVAVVAGLGASGQFQQYLARRETMAQMSWVRELAEYYAARGSWSGVSSIFPRSMGSGFGGFSRGMNARMTIIVANASGQVLFDSRGGHAESDARLSAEELALAFPIEANDQFVGYLFVPASLTLIAPDELDYLQRLRETLILAGLIAGAVGIGTGLAVSRALSAPLAALAHAANAFAARNWTHRVRIQGSGEIAAVGQAFNAMADELEEGEAQRRNMMADIAHELRTPLTVMQGNLKAMLDGVYPTTPDEIAALYDETRLLGRLVNDLRELALAEAGRLPLNLTPVDLSAALASIVSNHAPAAEAANVTLRLETLPGSACVLADADRLAQVLHNLIANALRHAPGGTVKISARQDGQDSARTQIAVRDDGEGIAPEDLPHVFDRFYRAEASRSRAGGGSGLGLAIAQTLVEAMGGTLRVESAPGKGSCFMFSLPGLPVGDAA